MDDREATIRFAAQVLGCEPPDDSAPAPGTYLAELRELLPRYEAGEIDLDTLYAALATHFPGSALVYKTSSNKYGNVMKRRESSKPFIVSVPGFEGNIGSAFTMNQLFWQPYTVFNILPSEIASVQLENFADTSASFSIFKGDHKYVLSDMKKELSGWDTSRVTRYLSYFARIPFEEWVSDMEEDVEEKLKSQKPLCRITLLTANGDKKVLTLWEKLNNENGTVKKDNDRLYGKTGERDDIFLMRYFDVDPILKKRTYFFPG